ncbi:MAG: hypothetical protein ABIO37_05700 [Caulobacteraceae bacterium]
MRVPIPQIEPVAIALDEIQTAGDVRFTGIDLESGARVSVLIERASATRPHSDAAIRPANGLVLVLTMETLAGRQ